MKYIEKQILIEITKNLTIRDRIKLWIFRKYTYTIYRIGYQDGYYFKE